MGRLDFKAATLKDIKEQQAEVNEILGYSSRASYLKISPGVNKFRIFPGHPGSKRSSFAYQKVVHWIPKIITKKEGDKETTTVERRPVFNSRIHGGTKKDLIEEYIKLSVKIINEECQDEKEALKKLDPILNWQKGLKPIVSWVFYANKMQGDTVKNFGLVEITNSAKEKLNDLSAREEADEAIITDPFTNPDTGKAIVLTYNKEAKKRADVYKLTLLWEKNVPLTDEEIEVFEKRESLEFLFINAYKRKDFELAYVGLEIFDQEHKIGIFDIQEWADIVDEINNYYPEDDEEESEVILDQEEEGIEEVESEEVISEPEPVQAPVFKAPTLPPRRVVISPVPETVKAPTTSLGSKPSATDALKKRAAERKAAAGK